MEREKKGRVRTPHTPTLLVLPAGVHVNLKCLICSIKQCDSALDKSGKLQIVFSLVYTVNNLTKASDVRPRLSLVTKVS